MSGMKLKQIKDIAMTGSPQDGDLFAFNGSTGKWHSASSANIEKNNNRGKANGYVGLDSNAKIPITHLPDSLVGQVQYQGTWNASTDTPTLPDATASKGYYYVTSAAGTYETISYAVGDWVISNGTTWEKVDNTDAVTSVFGKIGAVIAAESDYSSFYPTISQFNTAINQSRSTESTLISQVQGNITQIGVNETGIQSTFDRVIALEDNVASNYALLDGNTRANEFIGFNQFRDGIWFGDTSSLPGVPRIQMGRGQNSQGKAEFFVYADEIGAPPLIQIDENGLMTGSTDVRLQKSGIFFRGADYAEINFFDNSGGAVLITPRYSHWYSKISEGNGGGHMMTEISHTEVYGSPLTEIRTTAPGNTYSYGNNVGLKLASSVGSVEIVAAGSGPGILRVRPDETVEMDSFVTIQRDLTVNNLIRAGGDIVAFYSSDKRLKDNIEQIPNAIDKIQSIGGYSFNWNDKQDTYETGSRDIGVIAQEVEEVLPELVTTRDNGYKAVKYEKMVALLIEGMKEQQQQINELKEQINGTTN